MDWSGLGRVVWASAARAQRPTWPAAGSGPVRADAIAGPSSRLAPADRTTLGHLLAAQPDHARRAVLLAAVACGHTAGTVRRLSDRLGTVPDAGLPDVLDPSRHRLRQRSGTTCGSACLVTARALADPVYALWLLDGYDARTGRRAGTDLAGRFAAAERVVHARTTGVVLPGGRWQVPWPPALGTPPWAVATELRRVWSPAVGAGPAEPREDAGVTVADRQAWAAPAAGGQSAGMRAADPAGVRFRTRLVDPDDEGSRRDAADAVARTVAAGRTAALFVGDGVCPRHVTLAVGIVGGVGDGVGNGAGDGVDDGVSAVVERAVRALGLRVYEPGAGDVVDVPRPQLVAGRTVQGGWDRLWAVVVTG